MSYDYQLLAVEVADGVATVTINHPPINLFDLPLMDEIGRVGEELAADDAVKVIVFQSADPDFFIAHADVAHSSPRLVSKTSWLRNMETPKLRKCILFSHAKASS